MLDTDPNDTETVLSEVIDQVLAASPADIDAQTAALANRIYSHPMSKKLIRLGVLEFCRHRLQWAASRRRQELFAAANKGEVDEPVEPEPTPEPKAKGKIDQVGIMRDSANLRAAARAIRTGLLGMPMGNGLMLADWRGEALIEHATTMIKAGATSVKNGLFYKLVGERCGDRKVADVLSNDDLRKLHEEAQRMFAKGGTAWAA